MNTPLNARVVSVLYADMPASFKERIDGRMFYLDEGNDIYVGRARLKEAATDDPEFAKTSIYAELAALFAAFPEHDSVILLPT